MTWTKEGNAWRDGPVVTGDLVTYLAARRGVEDLTRFISPRWPDDLHDPILLPDMAEATTRLSRAVLRGEKIGLVGDYDIDGTAGTALVSQLLQAVGQSPAVILPTRKEGYGFAPEFVDRLLLRGVKVIVTIDCGIRDHEAVERANSLGCDVIILDHHLCPPVLPPAHAVVNPKRGDNQYPFPELCGTGLTFKLASALGRKKPFDRTISPAWLAWSLDLVGLATLGDLVSLRDENRLFALFGLKVISRGRRPGLRLLIQALGLDRSSLSCHDLVFKLIPKLNASGRLESMEDVLTLLINSDPTTLDPVIKRILTRDAQRQLLTKTIYQAAKARLENAGPLPGAIVLDDAAWHPGLTGLVAARLSEEFARPVAVLGSFDGLLFRGSLRSPNISLTEIVAPAAHILERFGGHEAAAGLTVRRDNLEAFRSCLAELTLPPPPGLMTDGTITPDQADAEALARLESLTPWGANNPEPLWSLPRVNLEGLRWLGGQHNHLKALVRGKEQLLEVIYFGAEAWRQLTPADEVDLYGTLAIDKYRGHQTPQMTIRGLRPAKSE